MRFLAPIALTLTLFALAATRRVVMSHGAVPAPAPQSLFVQGHNHHTPHPTLVDAADVTMTVAPTVSERTPAPTGVFTRHPTPPPHPASVVVETPHPTSSAAKTPAPTIGERTAAPTIGSRTPHPTRTAEPTRHAESKHRRSHSGASTDDGDDDSAMKRERRQEERLKEKKEKKERKEQKEDSEIRSSTASKSSATTRATTAQSASGSDGGWGDDTLDLPPETATQSPPSVPIRR